MVDAGIRPKRHQNIGSDVPVFAGALIGLGGIIGGAIVFVLDKLLHRHRR